MLYLVLKAGKRVGKNIRRYLFLMFQILLGTCMIAVSLNILTSFEKQFQAFKKEINVRYVDIEKDMLDDTEQSITRADYSYIRGHYNHENVFYAIRYDVFSVQNGKYLCTLLFAEADYYRSVMGFANYQENKVYAGEQAAIAVAGEEFHVGQDKITEKYFNKKEKQLFGKAISSFTLFQEGESGPSILLSDLFSSMLLHTGSAQDYILFPLSAYPASDAALKGKAMISLTLENANSTLLFEQSEQIVEYLGRVHEGTGFAIQNFVTLTEELLSRNTAIAQGIMALSAFVFFIVFFGLVGLLFVTINKRSREFAVLLMCGATTKQVFIEIYLEILAIVMSAVLLGNLISVPLLPMFNQSVINTTYHVSTFLLLVLGGLCVSTCVCVIAVSKFKFLHPIEVIKQ